MKNMRRKGRLYGGKEDMQREEIYAEERNIYRGLELQHLESMTSLSKNV